MNKIRLVLALLVLGGGLVSNAQIDDRQDGVVGSICQAGHHCPPPVDHGGGAPVDPSPYDPRPGRPDRPHHEPPGPQRPDRPDRPNRPDRPDRPDRPNRPDYPYNPGRPDRPDYPDYPGTPNYPDYPNVPNYGGDRREIYIGSRVQNQHLDLMRLTGLNSYNDRGTVIESVEVIAQPGAIRSEISLNVDGYVVDSENYPGSHSTMYPNRQLVIGQNFNQMSLGVSGVLYIDRIIVNLRSNGGYYPPQPPPPAYGDVVLPGYVNQTYYSNTTLDITRIVNLYQYRGYRVEAVTVRGRSVDSRGSARVVINGVVAGRVDLSYGGDTIRMPITAIVGQSLQSLNLQIVPTSRIDSVEVTLSRY